MRITALVVLLCVIGPTVDKAMGPVCPSEQWWRAQPWQGATDAELHDEAVRRLTAAGFDEECVDEYRN